MLSRRASRPHEPAELAALATPAQQMCRAQAHNRPRPGCNQAASFRVGSPARGADPLG